MKEERDLQAHASYEAHRMRMNGSHCVTQDLIIADNVPKTDDNKYIILLCEDIPRPIGRVHKVILWLKTITLTGTPTTRSYGLHISSDVSWTEASSFSTVNGISWNEVSGSPVSINQATQLAASEWIGWDITGDNSAGAMERYNAGATSFSVKLDAEWVTAAATNISASSNLDLSLLEPQMYDRTNGTDAPFLAVYGEGF